MRLRKLHPAVPHVPSKSAASAGLTIVDGHQPIPVRVRCGKQWTQKISDAVFRGLASFGLPEVLKGPSPLTAGLPLIDSPTPQLLCTATYLAMVFFGLCYPEAEGAW